MYRYSVFLENLDYIEKNQGETYTLGITQFADLSKEEFTSKYLTLVPQITKEDHVFKSNGVTGDSSFNWVDKGNVPAVKNQGQCGSCWAFSAAGTISIAYNIQRGGNKVNLSEQQLVSCDHSSNGCNGGWMDNAFDYNRRTGLATEDQYPYTSGTTRENGVCNTQIANQSDNLRNQRTNAVASDNKSLIGAISTAAVAVAVDASNWSFYKSGVFNNCSNNLNHGVIAVGYNTEGSTPYWIVRNSWGAGWGENGYINLSLGANTCGILTAASFVSV
jgi:cathepsin L